jgi:hypothetical protein
MSIASTIYQGSASYGRFVAILSAIVATIIAICLVVYGIKFNISVKKRSYNASAKIVSKSCPQKTSCTYGVYYIDNLGQTVQNVSFVSNDTIQLNSNIIISYDPNDKTDILPEKENKTSNGYSYMLAALFILLFGWGWVWVTRKYEFAASVSGFSSASNFFR